MTSFLFRSLPLWLLVALPQLLNAGSVTTPTTFGGLMNFLVNIIHSLIILIFGVAFLVLVWKIIDAWIIHADVDSKRSDGKTIAITAVIVMSVMASLWGILKILQQSFGY